MATSTVITVSEITGKSYIVRGRSRFTQLNNIADHGPLREPTNVKSDRFVAQETQR